MSPQSDLLRQLPKITLYMSWSTDIIASFTLQTILQTHGAKLSMSSSVSYSYECRAFVTLLLGSGFRQNVRDLG